MSNPMNELRQQVADWGANDLVPIRAGLLREVLTEYDRILACNAQGDRLVVTLQAEIALLRARKSSAS